jgi:stage V sporulation protein S
MFYGSPLRAITGASMDETLIQAGGKRQAEMIKVSAGSRSTAVAGAIAGIVRTQGRVDMQAIGAAAVNQALKAAAIARGYLLLDGIDVIVIPSFSDVLIEGAERTAVRFAVEPR